MVVSDARPETALHLRMAGNLDEERKDESEGGRDKKDKESRREGICHVNQVGGGAPDPEAIPLRSLLP